MFAKFAAVFVTALATTGAWSSPIASRDTGDALVARTSQSFNNWGGIASLNNFDNFFGVNNFDNFAASKQVVIQEQQVVCRTQQIQIIQQRLVILQEMAKRIITEQICEVEAQTIVFQQFSSSLGRFSGDLRRNSGRQVGYDSNIVNNFGNIIGSDGSISTNDFGFSGKDVGNSTIVPSGSNWNDTSSRSSVDAAYAAAKNASSSD